jgi:hypothetical protein
MAFFASGLQAGRRMIQIPHRFVQSSERRVGLLKGRMTEHVLQVVDGPASLEEARAAFVTQVVKVQVDRAIPRSDSGLSLVLPLSFGPVFFFQIHAGFWSCARRSAVCQARLTLPTG